MCSVCNGYVGCPVCSEEPQMCRCEICEGAGVVFEHIDGETRDLTLDQYGKLLHSIQVFYREIKCEACQGEGKILDEWDYSQNDDRYELEHGK